MKSVLLVGSSIFEAWRSLTEISPEAPVVNRAVGGTITADWVQRLADVLCAELPDVVLFYCGSNDINAGVAEETIVANVARCRQLVAAYSPETAFAYFGIIQAPQKLGNWDLIDRLNDAIRKDLPAGDLYVESNDVFVQHGQPVNRFFIEDGLHLTEEAYEVLATYARPLISDWLGLANATDNEQMEARMEWVFEFYDKQNAWSGVYEEEISQTNSENAASIEEFAGPGPKRVLELGAGGGQGAAATADLGHTVVAVELVPSLAEQAQRLADQRPSGQMTVINEDFYTVALDGTFDVVTYWDGFGVGSDDDQRRLFERIAAWLAPAGTALLDIGTPWYAASVDGRGWTVGEAERQYSFDAEGCRWEDTWWPIGHPEQAVKQSTRCYSPADLRLVLAGTGLELRHVKPGGTVDWEAGKWLPSVPLKRSMKYVAQLGVVR